MTRSTRDFWLMIGLSTCPIWVIPLGWRLSFHPSAALSWIGELLLVVHFCFMLLLIFAVVIVIASPFQSARGGKHRPSRTTLLGCLTFPGCLVLGMIWGNSFWLAGVERVALNGEPLVSAIQSFTEEHQRQPKDLEELVPKYLLEIPRTGIGKSPEFRYQPCKDDQYQGNPWILSVTPPCLILGFDSMYYFPLQNYLRKDFGGGLERVAGWGYYHE